MKLLFLTLFTLFMFSFCNVMQAQNYHVCDAQGEVYTIKLRNKTAVKRAQVINDTDVLEIPANAHITLIDSLNMKLYKIGTPCRNMLKRLLATDNVSVEPLTAKYLRYLWKKMCGNGELAEVSTMEQKPITIYRDIDSLCVDAATGKDSVSDTTCRPIVCKTDSTMQQDSVHVEKCRKAEGKKDEE